MTVTNRVTTAELRYVIGPVYRDLIRQVTDRAVWWHPNLYDTKTPTGGFVRHVVGRYLRFENLPELIMLWELQKGGFVEAAPAPLDPESAQQPRPVIATAKGLDALRGRDTTRE